MAQAAAVSASSRKTGKQFLGRLGRVLLFAVLIISAGLFMMGTLINVESIMGGNSGTVKECFLVLFAGGVLYAVAILYLWYYFALVLTNR